MKSAGGIGAPNKKLLLSAIIPYAILVTLGMSFFVLDPRVMGFMSQKSSSFGHLCSDFVRKAMENPLVTLMGAGEQCLGILVLALWALGCAGLGKRLLGGLNRVFERQGEREFFGFGAGFGAVGLLFLGLGLLGFLYQWLLIPLMLLILVIVSREALETAGAVKRGLAMLWRRGLVEKLALIYFFAILGILFIHTSIPVWDGDGNMYHTGVPRIWLMAHRIYLLPYIMHSNFPFIIESNYGAAMLIMGARLAKDLNLLLFGAVALGMISFGRRYAGTRAGVLMAVIWLSLPIAQFYSTAAQNDVGLAFFTFMALWALAAWAESRRGEWMAVFFLSCGGMLACKLVAMFGLAALFGLFIFSLPGSVGGETRPDTRRWVGYGIVLGALFCVPWFLKSFVYTGNPVWPFFYSIFGGRYWNRDAELIHFFVYVKQPFVPRTVTNFLSMPWILSMEGGLLTTITRSESLGPLLLLLSPLAWFTAFQSRKAVIERPYRVSIAGAFILWIMALLFVAPMFPGGGIHIQENAKTALGVLAWISFAAAIFSAGSKTFLQKTADLLGQRAHISFPALAFILFFVLWFLEFMYLRYLIQMVFCVAMVLGMIVAGIKIPSLRKFAVVVVFLFAGYGTALQVLSLPEELPAFFHQIPDSEFLAQKYPGIIQSSSEICAPRRGDFGQQAGSRTILLAFEVRGGLISCPYFWSTPDHQGMIDYHRISDKEAFLTRLGKMGVTHILLNRAWALDPDFQRRRQFEVYEKYYEIMEDIRNEALSGRSDRLKLVYPASGGAFGVQLGAGVELYSFDPIAPRPGGAFSVEPGWGSLLSQRNRIP